MIKQLTASGAQFLLVDGGNALFRATPWNPRDPRVGQSLLQHLATHQAAGTHQQQAATLILQLPPGHAQAVAAATA